MTARLLDSQHARNDFAAAKASWLWLILVQAGLAATAALVCLVPARAVSVGGVVVGLLGTVVQFRLRASADVDYERAEYIRRLTLLADGLGTTHDAGDVATLLAETRPAPPGKMLSVPGDYYDSDLPPGPRRLAHILWQSAHFTSQLAADAARYAGIVAVGGIVAVMVSFVLLMSGTIATTETAALAAAGVALLSLFGFGTLGELARNYQSLAAAAYKVTTRCAPLVERAAPKLADIVPVLELYNTAVARTAPIPEYVYQARRDQLNDSWRSVRERYR